MVCIWPLASCFPRCQSCVSPPLCACAGTAAAQAVVPDGSRGFCVLSHNPKRFMGAMLRLVQTSMSCTGAMLQQLRAELPFALLTQVSVHVSHCTLWHFWDRVPGGRGLHRGWTPTLCTAAPVSYSNGQALSEAVSWHGRQKHHCLAKGTMVWWTRQKRKLSDQSLSE